MDDTLHASEPAFLIDEHRLEKLCVSIARQNNELARKLGQVERLSPSELMDLYYAQKGRCALSGLPLEFHDSMKHYRRIQLDHIIEKRAREAEKRVAAGESGYQFGKVACITNVQWVCRFANMIKEYVRSSGADYTCCVNGLSEQCKAGFPLRNNAAFLGNSGKRAFREDLIRRSLADNPNVSAPYVVELLAGTIGESSYQTVVRHMRELGWQAKTDRSRLELQREAIHAAVAKHGCVWASYRDFAQSVNAEFTARGLPAIKATHHVVSMAAKAGITIKTERTSTKGRRACPGDGSAFLKLLKLAGPKGMNRDACVDWLKSRHVADSACGEFLDQMMSLGCVYESSDGTHLIAALTRKEAAEKIGVSKNRLKKWGRMDWAGGISGPAYAKASSKGRTYYRHEDVQEFISEREPHHLDLSRCGQRIACVEGGKLGGRPTSQLLQNATA